MPVPVAVRPEVRQDIADLPSRAHQLEALRFIVSLKQRPTLGLRLTNHPTVGDLSDCRKIFFDEDPTRSPGYRIVYRLLPDETAVTSVEIIAVGPREDFAVYETAVERLN